MEKQKLVSAHCNNTGKHFCLELRQVGTGWRVVNFIDLSESDASRLPFDNPEAIVLTAETLVECDGCGGRRVSGCRCATVGKLCSVSDRYDFQCIYCSELVLEKNGFSPTIIVSTPGYDDIGQLLGTMNLSGADFDDRYDSDILFINCGTNDYFEPGLLRDYVYNGGCVYLSDLACDILDEAFPDILEFDACGEEGKLDAEVTDTELRSVIGNRIQIEFDLGSWAVIEGTPGLAANQGRVLLRAAAGTPYAGKPIMVSFKYGRGNVFYTSFHNYAQATDKEKMLLQLLLMKQLGVKTNKSVEQVGDLIGLNISVMRNKFRN